MERLTGLDAAFLYLETRTQHMHVGACIVLDPSSGSAGRLTREDLSAYMQARLHLGPYRKRLVQTPLRLDHPRWIEDPDFDIDYHVRRGALPAPGGRTEFAEATGEFMSRQLDRSRPLWEMLLLEGLEGGRVALLTKTHHALVDGVNGAELLATILQLSEDMAAPEPEEEWRPDRPPGDLRLLAEAGARVATLPLRVATTGAEALKSAVSLLQFGRAHPVETPAGMFQTSTAPWNGGITAHRRIGLAETSLSTVKEVKNALGGTVNDVVLAAVAGALREHLEELGVELANPVVAMVPVSTKPAQGGGNAISVMLVQLPTDEPDPVIRLRRVARVTTDAKEKHDALGASTIQQLAEIAPAGAFSMAAKAYSRMRGADRHRPIWNLIASNVPGPRFPLWCMGARIDALYPIGPIHDMNGLNITLFSLEDTIYVGINADRDLVPGVDRIAAGISEAVDRLAKIAGEREE